MRSMRARIGAGLAAVALCVAGCGGSDSGSTKTGGGGGDGGTPAVKAPAAGEATGKVTFCVAKDTTGSITESIKAFRKAEPGVTLKLLELPESQDEARA